MSDTTATHSLVIDLHDKNNVPQFDKVVVLVDHGHNVNNSSNK